jgi:hypothetical protein
MQNSRFGGGFGGIAVSKLVLKTPKTSYFGGIPPNRQLKKTLEPRPDERL